MRKSMPTGSCMRDASGRAVVRLGDPTDHGGEVVTALDIQAHGRPVAAEGCRVRCPRCGGEFRIISSRPGPRHKGQTIAFEGDRTECGATLLSSFQA